MRIGFRSVCAAAVLLSSAAAAQEILLEERGEFEGLNAEFAFEMQTRGARLAVKFTQLDLERAPDGNARFVLLAPSGETVIEQRFEAERVMVLEMAEVAEAGPYTIRISAEEVPGEWQLSVISAQSNAPFYGIFAGGVLMLLVGLAAGMGWWWFTGVQFRWMALGGGLWLAGLVLKGAFSMVSAGPVMEWLEANLPHAAHIAAASLYVGIQSSVFEIGAVILLACYLRSMAKTPIRALSIGLGAGALEAVLISTGPLISVPMAFSEGASANMVQSVYLHSVAHTSLFFLATPVERILAILAHVASRGLILYGFATHRVRPAVWGFLLFTGLDGVAGFAHVSGFVGAVSLWWIELMLLPFALISVFVISWLLRRWPAPGAAHAGAD